MSEDIPLCQDVPIIPLYRSAQNLWMNLVAPEFRVIPLVTPRTAQTNTCCWRQSPPIFPDRNSEGPPGLFAGGLLFR